MDATRVARAIRQQADEMLPVLQELDRLRAENASLRAQLAAAWQPIPGSAVHADGSRLCRRLP
jgi:hypothetical protein